MKRKSFKLMLEVLENHPQGITITELSQEIQEPKKRLQVVLPLLEEMNYITRPERGMVRWIKHRYATSDLDKASSLKVTSLTGNISQVTRVSSKSVVIHQSSFGYEVEDYYK